jgi:hypothetical protein
MCTLKTATCECGRCKEFRFVQLVKHGNRISPPLYGVHILRDGAWTLWAAYGSRLTAETEKTYLVDMLGLTAEIFVKHV